jgi:hypothetical protein
MNYSLAAQAPTPVLALRASTVAQRAALAPLAAS